MRTCDECSECCTVHLVAETNSPMWTPCQHKCDSGCGIYPDRPPICRAYKCAWLQGAIAEELRPDKWGVIFNVRRGSGDSWLDIHVCRADAMQTQQQADAVFAVAHKLMEAHDWIGRIQLFPFGAEKPSGIWGRPDEQQALRANIKCR